MWGHFGTSQWLYLRSMLYPAITLISFLASYEDYHTQGKDWSTRLIFGPKKAQYRFLEQMDLRKYLTPECSSCVNHPRLNSMGKTRMGQISKTADFLYGEQEPNGREWAEILSLVLRKQSSQPTNITTNQASNQSLTNQLTTYQPIKNQPTNWEPTSHQPANQPANQPTTNQSTNHLPTNQESTKQSRTKWPTSQPANSTTNQSTNHLQINEEPTNTNQPTSQSLTNQLTTYQPIKNQPTPTNPPTHQPINQPTNQPTQPKLVLSGKYQSPNQ